MSFIAQAKNALYDWMWSADNPVSSYHSYLKILDTIPPNSSILDVGAGNGIYFTNPEVIKMIQEKNLNIKCIDIDADALNVCTERVQSVSNLVSVECVDLLEVTGQYEYSLFVMSYPLIPGDIFAKYIAHAKTITKNHIILFHNLVQQKEPWLDSLKPKIGRITGVDFGKLTSIDEMKQQIAEWGFEQYEIKCLISAKYGELNKLLNVIPVLRNKVCNQYMISLDVKSDTIPDVH